MNLMVWHKVLISSAVACFLFYAGWEARHALAGVDPAAGWRAVAAAAGGVGLAVYLSTVWKKR